MAVREILKIRVGQDCIDRGIPRMTGLCPIWWALWPMLQEGRRIEVERNYVIFYVPVKGEPITNKTGFLPRKLSDKLVGEMKEAFFAGAATAYLLILNAPDLGDKRALELVESLHEEVDDFGQRLDERYIGPELGGERIDEQD